MSFRWCFCFTDVKNSVSDPQVGSLSVGTASRVDIFNENTKIQSNVPNYHLKQISVESVHSFKESIDRFKENIKDFSRTSRPPSPDSLSPPIRQWSSVSDQEHTDDFRIISKILNMESLIDRDMDEIKGMSEDDIKLIVGIYDKMQQECSSNLRKLCNGIVSTEDISRNILEDDVLFQLINIYSLVLTKCVLCISSLSSNIDTTVSLNEKLISTVSLYSEFLDKTLIIIDNICSDNMRFANTDINHEDITKEAMLDFIRVSNINQGRYKHVLSVLNDDEERKPEKCQSNPPIYVRG
jgi:hypothetical protein